MPIGSYVPIVRARILPPAGARATPADAKLLEDRAWYVMRLRTIEGYRKALELFSRATREFPHSASAYRGIAWARICTAGYDGVPPEAGEQREPMRAAIEAAAALVPDDADVLILKAAWAARYEYALDFAERLYLDGLNRDPRPVDWTSYAWLCTLTGRFAQAQDLFEKAHAADLFGFWHRHNLGSLAYFRRDYATAEKILREALEIEPDHACVRLLLARVLMHSGRGTEAIAQADWCRVALKGMTGAELYYIAALANAGEQRAAHDALRDFERNCSGRYTSSAQRAMALAALDETDQALDWLRRGLEERDYWMLNIGIDPAYDRLRPRAEFTSILRAIGLPG